VTSTSPFAGHHLTSIGRRSPAVHIDIRSNPELSVNVGLYGDVNTVHHGAGGLL